MGRHDTEKLMEMKCGGSSYSLLAGQEAEILNGTELAMDKTPLQRSCQ